MGDSIDAGRAAGQVCEAFPINFHRRIHAAVREHPSGIHQGERLMNQDIADRRLRFRSPLARLIGHIFFVAMVIAYLAFISYSYYGRLDSSRNVMRLVALWCLGAVAVTLVIRSWRKERQK
jgi:hypothetical protein